MVGPRPPRQPPVPKTARAQQARSRGARRRVHVRRGVKVVVGLIGQFWRDERDVSLSLRLRKNSVLRFDICPVEIRQPGAAIKADHDRLGTHISVNDTVRMHRLERRGHAFGNLEPFS